MVGIVNKNIYSDIITDVIYLIVLITQVRRDGKE